MDEQNRTFVIIGNGVAGTTAAEQLRRGDPSARIVLIGNEPHPLYNRVALPPFLRGSMQRERVFIKDLKFHEERRIELHLETWVNKIDSDERVVYTECGKAFPYSKLLVATGGRPNRLQAPGAEGVAHIYNFQTLDDTEAMIERLQDAKRAVVVGGSFIAYELAEAFRHRGLEVTWLIRGPHFLRRVLDEEGGRLVDQIAKRAGVQMVYGESVQEVKSSGGAVSAIISTSGRTIEADMVGLGLGMTLNTELLAAIGAEVRTGVKTDQRLRTELPDIFAAGDVAEFYDEVLQTHHTMGTWNNSASHGKVAASNMLGKDEPYVSVPTYTSGLFDSKLAVMGATPESRPGLESISRMDEKEGTYRRLFFLEGVLVGGVLIGDMKPRRTLLQLMRSRERVENPEELLAV